VVDTHQESIVAALSLYCKSKQRCSCGKPVARLLCVSSLQVKQHSTLTCLRVAAGAVALHVVVAGGPSGCRKDLVVGSNAAATVWWPLVAVWSLGSKQHCGRCPSSVSLTVRERRAPPQQRGGGRGGGTEKVLPVYPVRWSVGDRGSSR